MKERVWFTSSVSVSVERNKEYTHVTRALNGDFTSWRWQVATLREYEVRSERYFRRAEWGPFSLWREIQGVEKDIGKSRGKYKNKKEKVKMCTKT